MTDEPPSISHGCAICGHARFMHHRQSGQCLTTTPELTWACDCAAYVEPERPIEPPFISDRDALAALLVEWYRDDDGIADEMEWRQIERQAERWRRLIALGIDPHAAWAYQHPPADHWHPRPHGPEQPVD